MRKIYLSLFAALLTLTGCDKGAQTIEMREERDPLINSAQAFMDERKWDEAIAAFKAALEKEPRMATPHLQLATIYHNYKLNYIAAIYHYDRYLELRPDAEKTDFINDQKLKVAQALANTLINNSPEVKKVVQERNQLIKENQDLKRQLANALSGQKPVVESTPSQTATATIPKSAKPVEKQSASAVSGTHQVYHVVGGDTLTKIATRFYGDSSKWDVIFEANKDTMRSAGDLKVGQTIIIPALGN